MITISLCMIVKNEEHTIERCLNSVKNIADEIIIVDTGSTDHTKEIASKYTNKVLEFEWIDDFSAARNYSYNQATMDYILWLDADDVILPDDVVKLHNMKQSMTTDIDVVMMRYNTGFDQQGKVVFSYLRERLSKRSCCFDWKEPVHEHLEIRGNIINSDICITHTKQHKEKSTRNIQIYENLKTKGKELSPRGMYYYARELKDNERYYDAIRWFNRFLDSGEGWVEDNIAACGELAKSYLVENRHKESLSSMLYSFNYDIPRAETCCQLGYYFKMQNSYEQAAFWFELALQLEKPKDSWGFQQDECRGYIPYIECAVCYDKLGDYEKASYYNDRASEHKPDSPAVLHNRNYFESRLVENITRRKENDNVNADISND